MISVSIITPVFNSAHLIGKAIASVQEQSYSNWEMIIVDDGSTDNISEVINQYARNDHRIRFFQQQNAGASVARNFAIKQASNDWLTFLDADDWIHKDFFSKMIPSIEQDSSVDLVHCLWSRVLENGKTAKKIYGHFDGDPFYALAHYCPFSINSCIVRKSLAEKAGCFDPSFKTCGDWDFWQRVARAGAKIHLVPEVLSYYYMRPHSLSRDGDQLAVNGLQVIAQAYTNDPRVSDPKPEYAKGLTSGDLPSRKFYFISWTAGVVIGHGKTATQLLQHVQGIKLKDLSPEAIGESLLDAAIIPASKEQTDWPNYWPEVENTCTDFLIALEKQIHRPGFAKKVKGFMEHRIIDYAQFESSLQLGNNFAFKVDVCKTVENFHLPATAERFIGFVYLKERLLGKMELPVFDGFLPAWLIKDAIAEKFSWKILEYYFARTIYVSLEGESLSKDNNLTELHDRTGWKFFLQEVWNRPDWTEEMFYDKNAKERRGSQVIDLASDFLQVEISEELPDVRTKASMLRIIYSAGGINIGSTSVAVQDGRASAQMIRAAINLSSSFELCIAVVREALIGEDVDNILSLREQLYKRRNDVEAVSIGQLSFQTEKGFINEDCLLIGGPATSESMHHARRAVLPSQLHTEINLMCSLANEPAIYLGNTAKHIYYLPEFISRSSIDSLPQETGSSFLQTAQNLLTRGINKLFKRRESLPSTESTNKLLILRYENIADESAGKKNFNQFEAQLKYLSEAGFYNLDWQTWLQAQKTKTPIHGKPVALTFDLSLSEFYKYAWPLLKKYGFSATVLLTKHSMINENTVTSNSIAAKQIEELVSNGTQFGALITADINLSTLPPLEIVREFTQSRVALLKTTGQPLSIISYPQYDVDDVITHLAAACGYDLGFTDNSALALMIDPSLQLPRITTHPTEMETFISSINDNSANTI
jgi:glycosyltransferase involved in cell wall biosynthesis